jgi:capsular polysaccharide biosynthesis protein
LVGATGFSTAIVFAADYFDPSFRTPDEVADFLGSPVLVSLPAANERGNNLEKS